MNVNHFNYCPYCGHHLYTNRCPQCERALYSSPHPNVSVLICDYATREILLIAEPKSEGGKEPNWEIPGGFVDLQSSQSNCGESLEDALKREIQEEIGGQNAKAIAESVCYLQSFGDTYRDGTPIVTIYFIADIRKEKLSSPPRTDIRIKWFQIDDLPEFEYTCDRKAVESARGRF